MNTVKILWHFLFATGLKILLNYITTSGAVTAQVSRIKL